MRQGAYAVVVGGINVDIGGRSFEALVPADSNPGQIRVSLGGVGRNIAHNLRLLGVPVFMLTALGDDANAVLARKSCSELGIDLSYALTVPGCATSSYLYVEGPERTLALGICDAEIAEHITPAYLASCRALLEGAAALVMDGNIPEAALCWLAQNVSCPIFADPVSVTKGKKLASVMDRLYAVKPNRTEAEALAAALPSSLCPLPAIPSDLARFLRAAGASYVYISLGEEGLYAAGPEGERHYPNPTAEILGTNGAGDAILAGLVRAYLDGLGQEESARFALAVSALTMESAETVNPNLSVEAVRARAGL